MVFLNTLNAESWGPCKNQQREGAGVQFLPWYICQLEYGSTLWHQSGQAAPSEQHEQSHYSSRHARTNTHTPTNTFIKVVFLSGKSTVVLLHFTPPNTTQKVYFPLKGREQTQKGKNHDLLFKKTVLWIDNIKKPKRTQKQELGQSHSPVDLSSSHTFKSFPQHQPHSKGLCSSPLLWRCWLTDLFNSKTRINRVSAHKAHWNRTALKTTRMTPTFTVLFIISVERTLYSPSLRVKKHEWLDDRTGYKQTSRLARHIRMRGKKRPQRQN